MILIDLIGDLNAANNEITSIESVQPSIILQSINQTRISLAAEEARLVDIGNQIANIDKEIKLIETSIASNQAEIPQKEALLSTIKSDLDVVNNKIFEANLSSYISEVQRLESEIVQANNRKQRRSELLKKIESASKVCELYRLSKEALSPYGARQLQLDAFLKILESNINQYLIGLNEPRQVVFSTQSETGRETLEILVTGENGELMDVGNLSGGEGTRVSFAVRMGLSRMIGSVNSMLFVDEPFVDQDDQHRQDLRVVLKQISLSGWQVIVITHDPELVSTSEEVIMLSRR